MAKRDLILHNFGWKVFSVLLAALVWMALSTAEQRAWRLQQSPVINYRKFAVSVAVLNRADGAGPFTLTPALVEVEIGGNAAALEKLQPREIAAFVDASTSSEERSFRREVRVAAPAGFRIQAITPAVVVVTRTPRPAH